MTILHESDPHGDAPVRTLGPSLGTASAAAIFVHGRGATAESILELARAIEVPGISYLAPQAAGQTWYPKSFLSPIPENEPGISSGIACIARLVASVEAAGISANRVALLGFSQGACLSLEFAARNAKTYGAVIGLSGALIGPPGTPREYAGTLQGTRIFLGCSDVDSHIPLWRVNESAEVLERLGATVDRRIYPGMGHTVNPDELKAVRDLLSGLVSEQP
ncbi:MAG: dienelactone hydrolase family protein [Gemmatimonadaceae bacterium]